MSCKKQLTPDEFLSNADHEATEVLDRLGDVELPAEVNDALTMAANRIKESFIIEKGSKKAAEINWDHFTFATRDNQFKIDKADDGKWYITSEYRYFGDRGERWNKLSTEGKFTELAKDIELLKFLIKQAEKGDVERFMED